jgi:hypothetical protein
VKFCASADFERAIQKKPPFLALPGEVIQERGDHYAASILFPEYASITILDLPTGGSRVVIPPCFLSGWSQVVSGEWGDFEPFIAGLLLAAPLLADSVRVSDDFFAGLRQGSFAPVGIFGSGIRNKKSPLYRTYSAAISPFTEEGNIRFLSKNKYRWRDLLADLREWMGEK